MATTTIRVDVETHAHLVRLSEESGDSLVHTVRQATDALARQRFADRVVEEIDALRSDSVAWSGYLSDAEATAITDGIS